MSESRLKLVLVLSLVIMGVMAGFAVFRPLVPGREYSAVARESVIKADDQWIIQFDIINQEAKDMSYNLVWLNGGEKSTESVLVGKGRVFSYIRHIYLNTLKEASVTLTIYKDGETAPFETVTYHLN